MEVLSKETGSEKFNRNKLERIVKPSNSIASSSHPIIKTTNKKLGNNNLQTKVDIETKLFYRTVSNVSSKKSNENNSSYSNEKNINKTSMVDLEDSIGRSLNIKKLIGTKNQIVKSKTTNKQSSLPNNILNIENVQSGLLNQKTNEKKKKPKKPKKKKSKVSVSPHEIEEQLKREAESKKEEETSKESLRWGPELELENEIDEKKRLEEYKMNRRKRYIQQRNNFLTINGANKVFELLFYENEVEKENFNSKKEIQSLEQENKIILNSRMSLSSGRYLNKLKGNERENITDSAISSLSSNSRCF